jgi:hypothetical protein
MKRAKNHQEKYMLTMMQNEKLLFSSEMDDPLLTPKHSNPSIDWEEEEEAEKSPSLVDYKDRFPFPNYGMNAY